MALQSLPPKPVLFSHAKHAQHWLELTIPDRINRPGSTYAPGEPTTRRLGWLTSGLQTGSWSVELGNVETVNGSFNRLGLGIGLKPFWPM